MLKKIFLSLFLPFVFLTCFFVLTPVFSADFGMNQTAQNAGYDTGSTDPAEIVQRIVTIVLGLAGTVFFGLAVYGGFVWLIAKGNDEKVTLAKGILETATIGLIVVASSYAIARFVLARLAG